jgi:hypothetical protein
MLIRLSYMIAPTTTGSTYFENHEIPRSYGSLLGCSFQLERRNWRPWCVFVCFRCKISVVVPLSVSTVAWLGIEPCFRSQAGTIYIILPVVLRDLCVVRVDVTEMMRFRSVSCVVCFVLDPVAADVHSIRISMQAERRR